MRRRGLTLIELMVSMAMSIMIIAGAVSAYTTAIAFDAQNTTLQQTTDARIQFEQRLASLLRGAYISPTANDTMTYFLGSQSGNMANATSADTLFFTTLSGGINDATLRSDDDFETLNQNYGPQGGVEEVSLSMTPIGEAGQTKKGLFIREQRPADGDPTQGGSERVLDADITSIQFEFYNGADWDTAWSTSGVTAQSTTNMNIDTTGQDGRRIPSAVRVTYSLTGDAEGITHSFVVRLPQSDVTSANPIVVTGGTTTTP